MIKKPIERSPALGDETLVKYNNPVLKTDDIFEKERCLKKDEVTDAEELMNIILPPKEWEENGEVWIQRASISETDRLGVINLQELLDTRLQQRQARESGICPIRRELFRQCFDELIRQIVSISPERAYLLLRVRDEAKITMEAYQTLYHSSIAFGQRKALQAEEGISEMGTRIEELELECADLLKTLVALNRKYDHLHLTIEEQKSCDERIQLEEINIVKKANAQFKLQVDGILYQKK